MEQEADTIERDLQEHELAELGVPYTAVSDLLNTGTNVGG